MPSLTFVRQPRYRNHSRVRSLVRTPAVLVQTPAVQTLAARAIWSRFASPRAELTASPSFSRPNLFAGD